MPTPIIRISYGQPDIAVRLVEPGCGSQVIDYEHIRLVIQAPHCPEESCLSPLEFCGCWPGFDTSKTCRPPHEHGILIYDAFDRTDDGEIIFRFDSKLWKLPSGRYIGSVEIKDGPCLAKLDLDLCSVGYLIDRVTTGKSGDCE